MSADAPVTPARRAQAALPYAVVLAAGIVLYYEADRFDFEQAPGRIGPDAWPKMIIALMLVAALWGLVAALRNGKAAAVEDAGDDALARPPEIHPVRVWIAVAATIVYLLLLPVLGFFLATIVYTGVLMVLGGFRRPVPVAILSLATGLFFMFMFMRVVYVALPLGTTPFKQVSYALMAVMGVH